MQNRLVLGSTLLLKLLLFLSSVGLLLPVVRALTVYIGAIFLLMGVLARVLVDL